MKYIKFHVKQEIEEKILYKHALPIEEVLLSLKEGKPKMRKANKDLIFVVTRHLRYITIFFELKNKVGTIKTAYPSPKQHIRWYHKK